MPNIADYLVIHDSSFSVGIRTFEFALPSGAVLDQKAILAYMVNPDIIDHAKVHLRVEINNHLIKNEAFDTEPRRGVWETFDPTGILRAGDNSVQFIQTGGPTSILVSDVVLWFQRMIS